MTWGPGRGHGGTHGPWQLKIFEQYFRFGNSDHLESLNAIIFLQPVKVYTFELKMMFRRVNNIPVNKLFEQCRGGI